MLDRIETLEEKVALLVEKVAQVKARLREIQEQKQIIHSLEQERTTIAEEKDRLDGRVLELEQELTVRDSREMVVADRLKLILNRIDTLEADIAEIDEIQGQ